MKKYYLTSIAILIFNPILIAQNATVLLSTPVSDLAEKPVVDDFQVGTLDYANYIVGEWIRTEGCPNGDKMTQTFNADGTGNVVVPDCNKARSPYKYTMTFNWKTSGSTLTLEYLSVSEYCGVKQKPPGTFDMEFEATENSLRIVSDRYVRK